MTDYPQLQDLTSISFRLAGIAGRDGLPHIIDSKEEIDEAGALVSTAIHLRNGRGDLEGVCEKDALNKAKRLIKTGGRLQVNPVFSDIAAYRCSGYAIFGRFIPFLSVDIELISEIEVGDYAKFYVFYGGGGYQTRRSEVSITKAEWDKITAGLARLNSGPFTCHSSGAHEAEVERRSLSGAIATFEKVIGPKAGTDADIGGHNGNAKIDAQFDMTVRRNSYNIYGQQDCINEMQTTRGFVTLLLRHGLIEHHSYKIAGSVSLPMDMHVALLVFEESAPALIPWVIDSWVKNNGEDPDILDTWHWFNKWSPETPSKHYDYVLQACMETSP